MANTTAQEVIDFFESSFADKHVLPDSLELVWLRNLQQSLLRLHQALILRKSL